jgi:glutathione S-transferase
MLTIWGRPSSFNTQKVLWLADELGLTYQHIPAGGSFGGLDSPQFLAMNPHGRVPVIDDDGTVVWESHAILRYLAARYGGHQFWSDDPGARARIEPWMDWAQTTLQPDFLLGVFWAFYRTPEHARNWQAIRAKVARCAQHFRLLEASCQTDLIYVETLSVSRISPREPHFIVILRLISSGRPYPTSMLGISAFSRVPPIGRE